MKINKKMEDCRVEIAKMDLLSLLVLKSKLLWLNILLNEEIYKKQNWEGRR